LEFGKLVAPSPPAMHAPPRDAAQSTPPSSRSLPEHFPESHEQLPELRLVPLLRVQISLVVVDGVDQPSDLILVQVDLHAFKRMGPMLSFLRISTVQAAGSFDQRTWPRAVPRELQDCHRK
jgi:hypothetical protein